MAVFTFKFGLALGLSAAVGLAACTLTSPEADNIGGYRLPSIKHAGNTVDMDEMIAVMVSARAVLVGESHDRFDHHLNQLEIVERLHRRHPRLAIGMEQFQQPFQGWLDDYVNGSIDTGAMLAGTEYYQRWRYDYRLYDPILSYARAHRLPVVALNLPAELTRTVAAEGLDALSTEQAARIPQLDRSNRDYEERLRGIYEEHPMGRHGGAFENFYAVQLLWDEGMAARTAQYLENHPGYLMVVLAGEGHVDYGSGIPDRLARRIDGAVVTVSHGFDGDPERADYLLSSNEVKLPEPGMLGVRIDPQTDEARVSGFAEDSAARAAGVAPGDVIIEVDDHPVDGFAQLRARLWDKRPGDTVRVSVRRGADRILGLDVTLR